MRTASIVIVALLLGVVAPAAAGSDTSSGRTSQDYEAFRRYGGRGGLQAEFEQLADANPAITELVTIGRSVRGEDIVALRVTRRPPTTQVGRRPATLFVGGQHGEEWVGVEMVRRLARHVVNGYRSDRTLAGLVNTTEMWFVPVANPDGYDFSFTPGNRSWRKNLRDNDGDGRITAVDGVDLNRNSPTRWGYDDEGSSPTGGSDDFRGTRPASEPETRALDRLLDRVGFEFLLSYHSSTEAVLYGTSWQVATPTPDDAVYGVLAGDDAQPGVPGYDPGVVADLYTANGELAGHAHDAYGTLGFTMEMSTCETASASDPDDAWDPAACPSPQVFPDDETLLAAEFRKNLPFALAAARSAPDPSRPVSPTGQRRAPEFVVDAFDVSYGGTQPVAVVARRGQHTQRLNYRVNGGPAQRTRVAEWRGGERYGGERDRYYAELRGEVTGTRPGDSVEAWFTARHGRGRGEREVASEHFTYTVASGADALILASEDTGGVNPTYPAGTSGPKYADEYAAALDAAGVGHTTWDVDAQGVPHPLGVLGHFDTVVWETGDDRLPQDPEDAITDTFLLGPLPDIAVVEEQQYVTMAVRDYLNEGGKLVAAGENTQYHGLLGRSLGGIYYGLEGRPEEDCVVTSDFLSDCLLLSDDFAQYWLGASQRAESVRPAGVEGAGPLAGAGGAFGGPAVADNPLDHAGAFVPGPGAEPVGTYRGAATTNPFGPVEGDRYAGALRAPVSYQSIGRTVDLGGSPAGGPGGPPGDGPTLRMKLSYSTLATFHHVIVEAAPAGTDRWTTLRDLNGRTSTGTPSTCLVGSALPLHPFLRHYLTDGRPCSPQGTTGTWNAFTGESNGWVDTAFDLSPYAGGKVDLRVSYVTDDIDGGVGGGIGVFVDDTRVTVGDRVVEADGFESAQGAWSPQGPPPGSPPGNQGNFAVTTELLPVAAGVATEDTVLLGFGLESLATPADRTATLAGALAHLHE